MKGKTNWQVNLTTHQTKPWVISQTFNQMLFSNHQASKLSKIHKQWSILCNLLVFFKTNKHKTQPTDWKEDRAITHTKFSRSKTRSTQWINPILLSFPTLSSLRLKLLLILTKMLGQSKPIIQCKMNLPPDLRYR